MNKVVILCTFIFLTGIHLLQADCGVLPEVINLTAFDCETPQPVCFDLPMSEVSDYEITLNGETYSGSIAGCQFDTIYNYTYSTLFGQGNNGPYLLDNWTVNGTDYSFEFMTIDDLVALMNVSDPDGDWIHIPNMMLIVGGAPGIDYSNMDVTALVNNLPSIIGLNFGLNAQGSEFQVEVGTNEFIFTDPIAGCSDTVVVEVECFIPPTNTTITNLISADENPYVVCLDTTELAGNIVSIENACPDMATGFVNFLIIEEEYCVKYQGLKCNGMDEACIVICDDLGYCDTTFFQITVDNTLCELDPEHVQTSVLVNFSEIFCPDTTELPGNVVAIDNVCPDAATGNVDFDFDPETWCVEIFGINPGQDTACIVLTDHYGNQDTTFLSVLVTTPSPEVIYDTIYFGETTEYCLSTEELAGVNLNLYNDCPDLAGNAINFQINDVTLCAEAEGVGIGSGQFCLILCDEFGSCDTTTVFLTVLDNGDPCAQNPPPVALEDTAQTLQNESVYIRILDNDTIPDCTPAWFVILEDPLHGLIVLNNDGESVDYIPTEDYCGPDSFVYEVCNEFGCDTATVNVEVSCLPPGEVRVYTAFSPNGDGINDFFTIENIDQAPDNEVYVFNRWGNEVYHSYSYENNWEGDYDNQRLPSGTYFYKLLLDGGAQTLSGYVQIAR